jgi:hypothetical protein
MLVVEEHISSTTQRTDPAEPWPTYWQLPTGRIPLPGIPVYNTEFGLTGCLKSVLDGSHDGNKDQNPGLRPLCNPAQ